MAFLWPACSFFHVLIFPLVLFPIATSTVEPKHLPRVRAQFTTGSSSDDGKGREMVRPLALGIRQKEPHQPR